MFVASLYKKLLQKNAYKYIATRGSTYNATHLSGYEPPIGNEPAII